jgi:hypothetical protein
MKARGEVLNYWTFFKFSDDWRSKSVYLREISWIVFKNTSNALPNKEVSIYRVIRKYLRDFWPLPYSNGDGHAKGEHVNRGTDIPSFCTTLQVLDMSTLVTRQMSIF